MAIAEKKLNLSLLQRQDGYISLSGALAVVGLVYLVCHIYQIADLIGCRVRLQNIADAAAYSGATIAADHYVTQQNFAQNQSLPSEQSRDLSEQTQFSPLLRQILAEIMPEQLKSAIALSAWGSGAIQENTILAWSNDEKNNTVSVVIGESYKPLLANERRFIVAVAAARFDLLPELKSVQSVTESVAKPGSITANIRLSSVLRQDNISQQLAACQVYKFDQTGEMILASPRAKWSESFGNLTQNNLDNNALEWENYWRKQQDNWGRLQQLPIPVPNNSQ